MARSYRGNKSRKANSKGSFDKRDKRKASTQSDCPERRDARNSSLNDLSWYSKNPNLLLASGSFPYPYRPGMVIPFAEEGASTSGLYTPVAYPGVMVLDWVPSFGNSASSLDPASIAGKEFYSRVRDAYSGALDADAPDFMVYIGALDSVFAYLGWLKRLYRALTTFTPENLMLSEALLTAFGFQNKAAWSDLRQNKMRLWQGINELILKSRKFKCPAVMDLFNRHYWMSDNVYADAATLRAQLYVFNLRGVYKLTQVKEADTDEMVAGLQMNVMPVAYTSSGPNIDISLIEFGESLIQALDAWDDGYTISGYLQRAFKDVPSFAVAELLQDELISAQYVPEVLSQIENSRTINPSTSRFLLDNSLQQMIVTQSVASNAVVSNINIASEFSAMWLTEYTAIEAVYPKGVRPFINIRSDTPNVADTVIASRLQAYADYVMADGSASDKKKLTISIIAGTEVPLTWSVIYGGSRNANYPMQMRAVPAMVPFNLVTASGQSPVNTKQPLAMSLMHMFDWHPLIAAVIGEGSGTFWSVLPLGDTYNVSVIEPRDLENLHKICFYSELNSFNI